MNIKLVCMDLDGTINNRWELLPDLKCKLDDLWKKGVSLAIVTGRDPLGTLYFAINSGIRFRYLGTGGGGIIVNYSDMKSIEDLYKDDITVQSLDQGRSKTERLLYIQGLVGAKNDETLFIEDNPHPNDFEEMKKLKCHIGVPATVHGDWKNFVKSRGGIVSNLPCGQGTLEILNYYFNE